MEAAAAAPVIPTVSWAEFTHLFNWRQGEHVTLIAPTQSGKTTLIRALIPYRRHVMFLATKRRDKTIDAIERDGFKRMEVPQEWARRVIVYPSFPPDPDAMREAHRETFRRALMIAYRAGGWCVVADEARYLSQRLGLAQDLEVLWLQGASLGVSLVAATQRPRHIPLEAYDQPTHVFLWADSDEGNIRRLAELGGRSDKRAIMATVPHLPPYHFLYVNTRTGETVISKWEG